MLEHQNPFSLYDFLGYLVPGGFFLLGLSIIPLEQFYNIMYNEAFISVDEKLIRTSILGTVFIVILAYFMGHILSYISSMTIEKYSIWTIGYPSKYLFDDNIHPSTKAGWNLYFLNYYFPEKLVQERSWIGISQIIVQRFLLFVALIPVTIPLLIGVILLGMNDSVRKVFHDDLKKYITIKGREVINYLNIHEDDDAVTGENFRILYHYAVEKSPSHKNKMQNYVALYGFCRNITLSLVLLFWWFIYKNYEHFDTYIFYHGVVLIGFIATFFYLAFNKFYRKFSVECYMAITSNNHL